MVPWFQSVSILFSSPPNMMRLTNDEISADLKQHVIKPIIPDKYLDEKTIFHHLPSGRFVIGGRHGDAGLTGRKIIIDTYGGWGAHGGDAYGHFGRDDADFTWEIVKPLKWDKASA